jgi:hypothetical protein
MNFIKKSKKLSVLVLASFLANIISPCINFSDLYALEDATGKRTIAVLAFTPLANPDDQSVVDEANKRLVKSGKFLVVNQKDALNYSENLFYQGDKRIQQTLSEAQSLLDKGKLYYDRLQFKESIEALTTSLRKFKEVFPYLKDGTDYLRLLISLGMSYISIGDIETGKKYIMDMLRADPERTTRKLSESQFPPDIRAIYQARQDSVRGLMGGKIIVVSFPPGGTLYLDGFKVTDIAGSATIGNLPVGRHYLKVEKVGFTRYFQEIELGAQDVTVNAVMERWNPFGTIDPEKTLEAKKGYLKEAAATLGADALLLGEINSAGKEFTVSGQLFDLQTAALSNIEKEQFSDVKKAPKNFSSVVTALLKTRVSSTGEVVPFMKEEFQAFNQDSTEPRKEELAQERKSIFTKWWFWGIIAGAGALGGVLLFTDIAKGSPAYNKVTLSHP